MKTTQEWLRDPSLFATSAIAILMDAWGTEFMEWDPVAVDLELKNEFGVEPTPELMDRIHAASTLFTSNLFFLSLEQFSAVCNAFNFGVVSSELFLPADLDDVLWGVTEAYILLGEDAEETESSHNIGRYVGTLLSQVGITKTPSVLKFAEFDEYERGIEDKAFEDDVESQLYFDQQDEARENLEADNNVRVMMLFRQLAAIPLVAGNTDFIKSRLKTLTEPQPVQRTPVPA